MIYSIYYVIYNIEYILYSKFVSTILARTPPRMFSRRMLVLKVSRAPPSPAGGADTWVLSQEGVRTSPPNCKQRVRTGATHLSKQLCLLSMRGLGHVILYVIYSKHINFFVVHCIYLTLLLEYSMWCVLFRKQTAVCSTQ